MILVDKIYSICSFFKVHNVVIASMAWYGLHVIWMVSLCYGVVRFIYSTVQYSTERYSTVQYSTVRYSKVHYMA